MPVLAHRHVQRQVNHRARRRMMILSVESWNMRCPPAVLRRLLLTASLF